MRKTILDFNRMANDGEKVVYITAYDYLTAKYVERAGIDMILVGDSLGIPSIISSKSRTLSSAGILFSANTSSIFS